LSYTVVQPRNIIVYDDAAAADDDDDEATFALCQTFVSEYLNSTALRLQAAAATDGVSGDAS